MVTCRGRRGTGYRFREVIYYLLRVRYHRYLVSVLVSSTASSAPRPTTWTTSPSLFRRRRHDGLTRHGVVTHRQRRIANLPQQQRGSACAGRGRGHHALPQPRRARAASSVISNCGIAVHALCRPRPPAAASQRYRWTRARRRARRRSWRRARTRARRRARWRDATSHGQTDEAPGRRADAAAGEKRRAFSWRWMFSFSPPENYFFARDAIK